MNVGDISASLGLDTKVLEKGIANAAKSINQLASKLDQVAGKVETSFQNLGKVVDALSKTIVTLNQQSQSAAANLQKQGVATEEVAKKTTQLATAQNNLVKSTEQSNTLFARRTSALYKYADQIKEATQAERFFAQQSGTTAQIVNRSTGQMIAQFETAKKAISALNTGTQGNQVIVGTKAPVIDFSTGGGQVAKFVQQEQQLNNVITKVSRNIGQQSTAWGELGGTVTFASQAVALHNQRISKSVVPPVLEKQDTIWGKIGGSVTKATREVITFDENIKQVRLPKLLGEDLSASVSRVTNQQKTIWGDIGSTVSKVTETQKTATVAQENFAAAQSASNSVVKQSIPGIQNLGKAHTTAAKGANDLAVGTRKIASSALDAGNSFTRFIKGVATGMIVYRGIMMAMNFVSEAILGTIKAGVDFEDEFGNIKKVFEATQPEFAALQKGFRNLALEIPVPVKELMQIGTAAGQLGIEKQNVIEFTRVMAMLAATSDTLKSDEASAALAKFANITRMSKTDFDKLGSSILMLGNTTAATESAIINMSTRIAQAGTRIRMTVPQILAWATALSSAGVRPEMGGTAFSRLILDIDKAVATSSKKLNDYAKVAGMTAQAFRDAFRQSPNKAIMDFIQGLQEANKNAGNVTIIMDRLGLSAARTGMSIGGLVEAWKIVQQAMITGQKGWDHQEYLFDRFGNRIDTTAKKAQLFRQHLNDLQISLEQNLKGAFDKTLALLQNVTDGLANATLATKAFGVAVAGLIATLAVGSILRWITAVSAGTATINVLSKSMSALILLARAESFARFIQILKGIATAAGLTGDKLGLIGRALSVITSPVGIAIGALTGLGIVVAKVIDNDANLKSHLIDDWNGIKGSAKSVWDDIVSIISGSSDKIAMISKQKSAETRGFWESTWKSIQKTVADETKATADHVTAFGVSIAAYAKLSKLLIKVGRGPWSDQDIKELVDTVSLLKSTISDVSKNPNIISDPFQLNKIGIPALQRLNSGLSNYSKNMKKVGEDAIKTAASVLGSTDQDLSKEQQALVDSMNEAARPADYLAKKMQELSDLNQPLAYILSQNAAKLLQDADAQKALGNAMDASTQSWIVQSKEFLKIHPSDAIIDWMKQIRDLKPLDNLQSKLDNLKNAYANLAETTTSDQMKAELADRIQGIALIQRAMTYLQDITSLDDKELATLGLTNEQRKRLLDKLNDAKKAVTAYVSAEEDALQAQEKINLKGPGGPDAKDIAKFTSDFAKEMQQAWISYGRVEQEIDRAALKSKIDQLQVQRQIVDTIVPMYDYQKRAIEEEKIHLDSKLQREQLYERYLEQEEEIRKNIEEQSKTNPMMTDSMKTMFYLQKMVPLAKQFKDQLDSVNSLEIANVIRMYQQQYLAVLDTIKQGAGTFFDEVILKRGQSTFKSLLDWIKNTFLNQLRKYFQETMTVIFDSVFRQFKDLIPAVMGTGTPKNILSMFPTNSSAMNQASSIFGLNKQGSVVNKAEPVTVEFSNQQMTEFRTQTSFFKGPNDWFKQAAFTSPIQQAVSGKEQNLSDFIKPETPLPVTISGGTLIDSINKAASTTEKASTWMKFFGEGASGMNWTNFLGMGQGGFFGGNGTPGFLGAGTGGIKGKGVGGAVGGMMTAGGMMLFTNGLKQGGFGGALQTTAGGAMTGYAMGGPIGAAIGAAAGLLAGTIKGILGKSTEQAGAMEVARDLGGTNVSSDQFKSFYQGVGLNESSAWGIRKDLIMSPKFLQEIALPAAQASGSVDALENSLKNITTSFGTFDFSKGFKVGEITGDWSLLNKEFIDAFSNSKALQQAMPNWQDLLTINDDTLNSWEQAIKNLSDFKKSITALTPTTNTMYQNFLDTGVITDEFAAHIKDLGGSIDDFQHLGSLIQTKNQFTDLTQTLMDTGELLPELRQMFKDFGVDLTTIDEALPEFKNLTTAKNNIESLKSGLQGLISEFDPINQFLQGNVTQGFMDLFKNVPNADISGLLNAAPVIKMETGWDKAMNDFLSGTKKVWNESTQSWGDQPIGLQKGGVLEQALLKYGGQEGQTAVEKYYQGFNTITQDLLDSVKMSMDQDYQTQVTDALTNLGSLEQSVNDRLDIVSQTIISQTDLLASKIDESIGAAAQLVTDSIDKMIEILAGRNITDTTPTETTPPTSNTGNPYGDTYPNPYGYPPVPGYALGGPIMNTGLVLAHAGEWILSSDQVKKASRRTPKTNWDVQSDRANFFDEARDVVRNSVTLSNCSIYGYDDFVDKVRRAGLDLKKRIH